MFRSLLLAVIFIGAGILLTSCTEENHYHTCPDPSVQVTGEVLAWYCGIRDFWNPTPEPRYTVATGERASVKFVSLSGNSHTVLTDDSSAFSVWLELGAYDIVVQLGHAYPDTIEDVSISGDTLLEINTIYDYLTPDTLDFYYYYSNAEDTLGAETEWSYLWKLNSKLHTFLNFYRAERMVRASGGMNSVSVHFHVPIREGSYLWEANEQAQKVRSWLGGLPDNLFIAPDTYICMD